MTRTYWEYGKIRVITNPAMTVSRIVQIRRTWKERFFSLPWKPWVGMKPAVIQEPSRKVIFLGGNTAIMHPDVAARRAWIRLLQ